jgi:hypothetical protein
MICAVVSAITNRGLGPKDLAEPEVGASIFAYGVRGGETDDHGRGDNGWIDGDRR